MRLRLNVPKEKLSSLKEKLNAWNANTVSEDQFGSQPFVVSLSSILLVNRSFLYAHLMCP